MPPDRPRLKPWYRVCNAEASLVFEYADGVVVFEGGAARELLPALVSLLDGRLTQAEIVATLGPEVAPAVEKALAELDDRGLLLDGPPLEDDEDVRDATAVVAAGVPDGSLEEIRSALASSRVHVVGASRVAALVSSLLLRSGVGEVRRTDTEEAATTSCDLVVAAPEEAELALLDRLNEHALLSGVPWLQVLPFDGRHTAIGPLFVPGETCCRHCYLTRRAAASGYASEFWRLLDTECPRRDSADLAAVEAGLAAHVALRWLAGAGAVAGEVLALELWPTPTLAAHTVYRVPRCSRCVVVEGDPLPWFEEAAT